MLRVVEPVTAPPLSAAERFALTTLLDHARVLVTERDAGVELRIVGKAVGATVAACEGRGWGLAAQPGIVELERSTLRLVADVAGVVSEQRSTSADRYGRVPADVNALVVEGRERVPVVGLIAAALRRHALVAAQRGPFALLAPWPEGRRWAAAMTHDLDVVSVWPAFTALRLLELLRKGELGRAGKVLGSAAGAALADPIFGAARHVIETERMHGVRSTWFVITGTPTFATMRAGDVTYTPETPRARRVIALATGAGHEVGLHGSFETYVTAARFARQRERLRAIVGADIHGVRQHFLRMRPGTSHRAMLDAGFRFDSTCGFPDRNGFRMGAADVTPVWDEATQQALAIDEVPFVWMDRALSKYQGIEDPLAWIDDGLEIANACRETEGVWNGIWHPNLASPLGYPGAPAAFEVLVRRVMERSPWSATLSDIVSWRRARRAARAVGVAPDGRIRVHGEARIALEDASGTPLPWVAA